MSERKAPHPARRREWITAAAAALAAALVLGAVCAALLQRRRAEQLQSDLLLAAYAADALRAGDAAGALSAALEALPEKRGLFDPPYTPQAQRALANAMGVYDLTDGYKAYRSFVLPSAPAKTALSPDGGKAAALVQDGAAWFALVFDVRGGGQAAALPVQPSALSDFAFRDNGTLLYAGENGFAAYDLAAGRALWETEQPATKIALSGDGRIAATVCQGETKARLWNAVTGESLKSVNFGGRRAIAEDGGGGNGLFALDERGHWLAVSFPDGELWVYDLQRGENDMIVYGESDYTHFEGGFCEGCFAFCANGPAACVFTVIDLEAMKETGSVSMESPFHLCADKDGLYLSSRTRLLKIDPRTWEQTEAARTEAEIASFTHTPERTLVLTAERECLLFDANAAALALSEPDARTDFAAVAGGCLLTASRDTPRLRIRRWSDASDAQILSYPASIAHDGAYLAADRSSALLWRSDRFRVIGSDGEILAEMEIPSEKEVYLQKYRRNGLEECLEVIYNDGQVRRYSARTGALIAQEQGPLPDTESPPAAFEAAEFRIEAAPDGWVLLDRSGGILADLPGLCDVLPDGTLVFDDLRGNLRGSRIWTPQELIRRAKSESGGS